MFTAELTVGILAVVFQEKVVADLKTELTGKLKKEYGLASALTAAVDMAQTRVSTPAAIDLILSNHDVEKFECCGIEGPNDYTASLWKLQNLGGPDAMVSKTCCLLLNMKEDQGYVNPRPVNDTLCQSEETRYNALYRHQQVSLQTIRVSRNSNGPSAHRVVSPVWRASSGPRAWYSLSWDVDWQASFWSEW